MHSACGKTFGGDKLKLIGVGAFVDGTHIGDHRARNKRHHLLEAGVSLHVARHDIAQAIDQESRDRKTLGHSKPLLARVAT